MSKIYKKPIIRASKNLPLAIRVRDAILTILVWILYAYLMKETFVFANETVNWAAGGFHHGAPFSTLTPDIAFAPYIWSILLIQYIFFLWSFYNDFRYGRKTRRRARHPVSPQDMADIHRLDVKYIKHWQTSKTLVMSHDKNGRLVKVSVK